jgi:hypothetical protein
MPPEAPNTSALVSPESKRGSAGLLFVEIRWVDDPVRT